MKVIKRKKHETYSNYAKLKEGDCFIDLLTGKNTIYIKSKYGTAFSLEVNYLINFNDVDKVLLLPNAILYTNEED